MDRVERLNELFGARVALRYRFGERDGRALYSDAVGELSRDETDDAAVVVATRRGPVRVDRSAVVAVRAVPPPVPRRPSWAAVARLEGLCADAWPAQVDVALGAWRLRAGGFTGRASGDRVAAPPTETPDWHAGRPAAVERCNAALAIGDPGLPLPQALDAVRAFAAAHGVPARVQVPMGSPWDRAVASAGWVLDVHHEAGAEVAVLVGDLRRLAVPAETVALAPRADDAWWELALGRAPTPVERGVLDPGTGLRTAFGLLPGTGAIRPHAHGGGGPLGAGTGRPLGGAAGRAAQRGGAGVLRRARVRRAPPVPLPRARVSAHAPRDLAPPLSNSHRAGEARRPPTGCEVETHRGRFRPNCHRTLGPRT